LNGNDHDRDSASAGADHGCGSASAGVDYDCEILNEAYRLSQKRSRANDLLSGKPFFFYNSVTGLGYRLD
jgi:hypothetical protein